MNLNRILSRFGMRWAGNQVFFFDGKCWKRWGPWGWWHQWKYREIYRVLKNINETR